MIIPYKSRQWKHDFAMDEKDDFHEKLRQEVLSGTAHDRLSSAIQGRGAFRRFKDAVIKMGINQEWYDFQADAYKRKAIRWCEDNRIEYEE